MKKNAQPTPPPAVPVRRILIVDDHPIMRQGLAQLINHEAGLTVCGEAASTSAAMGLIAKHPPDLAIVDLALPGRNGLELIKHLRVQQPTLPVLVLSMHDETLFAERALRAGARGYIMKQAGGKLLLDAIRHVLAGNVYVSPQVSARILENFARRPGAAERSPIERLTDREFEVFQLLGHGRSTREIAEELNLSSKTVEVHRANARNKLGLKTGAKLVTAAIRWAETADGE